MLAVLRRAEPKGFAAIQAIGLSGQMHGAVVLGADDRPLRPAILWNDGRAQAECRLLAERVPEIGRIAGVPPTPGYTAPKLLWLAAHEPALFARVAKVLLPKDYVRLRLTGEHATDPVDAAGTLWLDEARRAWSPEILAATGLSEAQLPRVVEGSEPAGAVRACDRSRARPACRHPGRGRCRRRGGGCDRHRRHRRRRRLRLARHLGAVLRHHRRLPPLSRSG